MANSTVIILSILCMLLLGACISLIVMISKKYFCNKLNCSECSVSTDSPAKCIPSAAPTKTSATSATSVTSKTTHSATKTNHSATKKTDKNNS